jgi:hypothetical protein
MASGMCLCCFLPVWPRFSRGKARGAADIKTERAQVDDIAHAGHAADAQLRQLHLVFQMRHGRFDASAPSRFAACAGDRRMSGHWRHIERSKRACSLAAAAEVETGSTLLGQRRTKPASSRTKSSQTADKPLRSPRRPQIHGTSRTQIVNKPESNRSVLTAAKNRGGL